MSFNKKATAIARAIHILKGQVKVSEARGVTQQAVSLWYHQGYAPEAHWKPLERATRGRVTVEDFEADYNRLAKK